MLVVYDDAMLCKQDPEALVTHDTNVKETVLESWHNVGKQVGGHPFEKVLATCCRFLRLFGCCRAYVHSWS